MTYKKKSMKILKDLFEHQLKDLYNAETQQIEMLPKIIEKTNSKKLKSIFEKHLDVTKNQKKRLVDICESLKISPKGEICNAMKGLIEEAQGFIDEKPDTEIMDVGLIAEAQRIEHYEISGYGTASRYAKELGYKDIAENLREILDEEYTADKDLNDLAEDRLNDKAQMR